MSSNWYADRILDIDHFSTPCMHRNVVVDTSGSRRFVTGEVTDDIILRGLCLDCGEFLSESEDRGTWCGEFHEIEPNLEMEGDYENE